MRDIPRNPYRNVKKICEKCNKTYKEHKDPINLIKTSDIKDDGTCDRIEEEFLPYCNKCFNKDVKRYKKTQWITTMLKKNFIGEDFLLRHRNGKVSQKELDDLWREFNCL